MICMIPLMQSISAQRKIDISTELLRSSETEKKRYAAYFLEAENELEMAYTGLFVFYKAFISSQDGSNCSFTPSCSEYAVQCIKRHGIVKGPIKFLDRYTRCNSLSPGFYKKDLQKNRLIDEVDDF